MDHNKEAHLKHINREMGKIKFNLNDKTNRIQPSEQFCKVNGEDYSGEMSRTISGASCGESRGKSALFNPEYSEPDKVTNEFNKNSYSPGRCRWLDESNLRIGKYGLRPACKVNQDRFGNDFSYSTAEDGSFWGGPGEYSSTKCSMMSHDNSDDGWNYERRKSDWGSTKDNRFTWQSKPVFYTDYHSYAIFNKTGNHRHILDGNVGGQYCWVGTPSYAKWDCSHIETTASDTVYGKHGVTKQRVTGFIINGGTYEKIKKIATSGICGAKDWEEFCWTGNGRKTFATDYLGKESEFKNEKISSSGGDTELDQHNAKFSTYITKKTGIEDNVIFDVNENDKVYGVSIIGMSNMYWIQLGCEYGHDNPIIDETWYNDGPEYTTANYKFSEDTHRWNARYTTNTGYRSKTEKDNNITVRDYAISNSTDGSNPNCPIKGWFYKGKANVGRDRHWYEYQSKNIRHMKNHKYMGKLPSEYGGGAFNYAKLINKIGENKAKLSYAETHEKNYNWQEGWMRITLSENVQLRRLEFEDAKDIESRLSDININSNFSVKRPLSDIEFEIYIYSKDYTHQKLDDGEDKVNLIHWPDGKYLQNIHKPFIYKEMKDAGTYNGYPTLLSPAADATDKNSGYMTKGLTGLYSYTFNNPIDAKFILIRFKTRTVNYGIGNFKLYRVYNNFQLNYANTNLELQDQSGYKIKNSKLLSSKEVNFINNINELGKVNIIDGTDGAKIIDFSRGTYKLAQEIPVKNDKIMMFSVWMKLPIKATNEYHFLVTFTGDLSSENKGQLFSPITINTDQNTLGCYYENQFISSNIYLGELKEGWHNLIVFINPIGNPNGTDPNLRKGNIIYYLNGLRSSNTTWCGKISGISDDQGISMKDYKFSCIGSDGSANYWTPHISNLEIYLNFGHQFIQPPHSSKLMIYKSSRISTDQIKTYLYDRDITGVSDESLVKINKYKIGYLSQGMMDNIVEYKTSLLKRSTKIWKKNTCPSHVSLIKGAVNAAKALAVRANRDKLEREQNKLNNIIKSEIEAAKLEAHSEVIDYVSNSSNLIIWDNVDKHLLGQIKSLELVVPRLTTLAIKNIQLLGEFQNMQSDWIQHKETKVHLSTLPKIKSEIEASNSISVTGKKSEATPGAVSFAECPEQYWLTGCKAYSNDGLSNNSTIIKNKNKKHICKAFNSTNGNGVNAVAQCVDFKGNNISSNSFKVFKSDPMQEDEISLGCDSTEYDQKELTLLGCSAHTANSSNCIDSVYMKNEDGEAKCFAKRRTQNCASAKISLNANCMISERPSIDTRSKILMENGITNISKDIRKSENPSLNVRGDKIMESCKPGYILLDGGCSSASPDSCAYKSSPYSELNEFISENNDEYGNGVYSHANCAKFNIIDDNCIDGNLLTLCATDRQFRPKITFTFGESIKPLKLIIWNRHLEDSSENLPLHINLKDQFGNIVLTGIKKDYNSNIIIKNNIKMPPQGCNNPYDDFGNNFNPGSALADDENISSQPSYRRWVNISTKPDDAKNNTCNFVRIINKNNSKYLAVSDPETRKSESIVSANNPFGEKNPFGKWNSLYMHNESETNYLDFCGVSDKNQLRCLKVSNQGYTEVIKPSDQEYSYEGKTGEEIKKSRMKFDTSQCITNEQIAIDDEYECNAGFYCSKLGYYYLFKNSKLDNDNIVLWREFTIEENQENENLTCAIMNETNWPGVSTQFNKIDATLYFDFDPEDEDNITEIVYFFSGNNYIKFDLQKNEPVKDLENKLDYVKNIKSGFFNNLPFNTITSACYIGNNKCLFFNGDKYIDGTIDNNSLLFSGNVGYLTNNSIFKHINIFEKYDLILWFYNLEKQNILFFNKNNMIDFDTENNKNRCNPSYSRFVTDKLIKEFNYGLWDIDLSNLFKIKRIHLLPDKLKSREEFITIKTKNNKINIELECDT